MSITRPFPGREGEAPAVHHGDIRPMTQRPPHAARMLSAVQLTGAVLAIPVALASAYSVYRTNFSPEVQCQSLRADIIAMIDRKIDASTRRMLVRRDVETFQKACGNFDPDARAAFSTLLAKPREVTQVAVTPNAETKAAPRKVEAPKPEIAKAEPTRPDAGKVARVKADHPKEEAARQNEQPAQVANAVPAAADAKPVADDARWLDAVRGALVTHAEPASVKAAEPVSVKAAEPPPAIPIATNAAAPSLPPAISVPGTSVPGPTPSQVADDDRPVPPAAIPGAEAHLPRSSWISHIPFVGQVLDK